jgi:hypothetical protein
VGNEVVFSSLYLFEVWSLSCDFGVNTESIPDFVRHSQTGLSLYEYFKKVFDSIKFYSDQSFKEYVMD